MYKSSGGGGGSNKSDKNSPEYQRKQWEANTCNMVDGVLYINSKTCRLNTSHGIRQHDAYVKNSSSLKLASTHFYVKECTCLAQGYTGVMKTASGMVTSPPTVPGPASATGLTTLTIQRSKLESMLADYECNSTNPDASDLSDMLRSLFLN